MHSADIQRGVMEWSGVECEGGGRLACTRS